MSTLLLLNLNISSAQQAPVSCVSLSGRIPYSLLLISEKGCPLSLSVNQFNFPHCEGFPIPSLLCLPKLSLLSLFLSHSGFTSVTKRERIIYSKPTVPVSFACSKTSTCLNKVWHKTELPCCNKPPWLWFRTLWLHWTLHIVDCISFYFVCLHSEGHI